MMLKKLILITIKAGRALFYNTPVHRSKFVNYLYKKLFYLGFNSKEVIEVSYEQSKFQVPTKDITILPSLLNNNYEKLEFELLRRLLKPNMTFVDVGANIGLYTIFASKAVKNNGLVIAFEPEPSNLALLRKNISLNKRTNIIVEPSAVGAEAGSMELYLARNSIGTHSLLPNKTGFSDDRVEVPVTTLDKYLNTSPDTIDVLKIDVEGYEPYVLKGGKRTLKNVRHLLFEFNGHTTREFGINEFEKLIADFSYLYGIDTKKQKLYKYPSKNFSKDKYVNILASKTEVMT